MSIRKSHMFSGRGTSRLLRTRHSLKTFTNLLFTLFCSAYPLYLQVKKVIKALNAYERNVLNTISFETKTAILWILLLQTSHFAVGNKSTLAKFKVMLDKLTAKDSQIFHAEVPVQFFPPVSNMKRKRDTMDNRGKGKKLENGDIHKCTHPPVHLVLKKFFGGNVLRVAKRHIPTVNV